MKTQSKEQIIERISRRLSAPRMCLSVILAITSGLVFLISAVLLRFGMTTMASRYVLSIVAGYIIFLLLLRIWIFWRGRNTIDGLSIDLPVVDLNFGSNSVDDSLTFGGGGDFAGAGAGGSWTEADAPMPAVAFVASPNASAPAPMVSGATGRPDIDLSFDLDDGIALLAVIAIAVLIFGAVIYVVWIAPALLAELMIDTAVVGGLYKPARSIGKDHWLKTALRKTAVPALIITFLFGAAGMIMQAVQPDAVTAGHFLRTFWN